MFSRKYGIPGEGEHSWMLGIAVRRDRAAHLVSLSQESCIYNLLERKRHYSHYSTRTWRDAHQRPVPYDRRGITRHAW